MRQKPNKTNLLFIALFFLFGSSCDQSSSFRGSSKIKQPSKPSSSNQVQEDDLEQKSSVNDGVDVQLEGDQIQIDDPMDEDLEEGDPMDEDLEENDDQELDPTSDGAEGENDEGESDGEDTSPEEDKNEVITEVKLGIGYEDLNDFDYNDSVFCFTGKFSYNTQTGKIVSLENQSIDVVIKRNAGKTQNMHFFIESTSGALRDIVKTSDVANQESRPLGKITFNKGDILRADLSADANKINRSYLPYKEGADVTKPRIIMEKDTCRTSGI